MNKQALITSIPPKNDGENLHDQETKGARYQCRKGSVSYEKHTFAQDAGTTTKGARAQDHGRLPRPRTKTAPRAQGPRAQDQGSGTRNKGPGTRSRGEHGMQGPVRISLLIRGGFIIMHDPPDIY